MDFLSVHRMMSSETGRKWMHVLCILSSVVDFKIISMNIDPKMAVGIVNDGSD